MELEFFRDRLALLQSETLFRLGTDAMVLADFAQIPRGAPVCDLCAGTGALSLLRLAEDPTGRITAVELQPEACALLRQTAARNGLEERLSVLEADLRQHRTCLPHGAFRHLLCNPPYYPVTSGFVPEDRAVAIAKTELCCTLAEVVEAADWLLQTGGSLWLVHKPERLTDLLSTLRNRGLEPKRLRFVQHRQDLAPSLVLLRAVKGGKPGLEPEPALVLQNPEGTPTAEYRRIYHISQQEPTDRASCSPEVFL